MIRVTVTMTREQFRSAVQVHRHHGLLGALAEVAAELNAILPDHLRVTSNAVCDAFSEALEGHNAITKFHPFNLPDAEAIMFKMVHGDGPFTIELAPC